MSDPTAFSSPAVPPIAEGSLRDNLRGIIWALVSVLGASLMSLSVRMVALEVDSRMVVMARAGITAVIVIIALILVSRWRRALRFSKPWTHLFRGLLIGVSTNMGFYTLVHIPLATATVLFFTAPIFATVLGAALHNEKVGPRRIIASAAGFCGALVILRPGFEAFHPAMLVALGSSALFAVALSLSRGLANADGAFSTYFSSVLLTVAVTLPIAMPVWELPGSGWTWVAVAVLVATSALRGIADIQAYRFADAAILAPIAYLRLVLIGFGAWLLFAESIDRATAIGAAIIIGSTLYIARREAALRKR